MTTEPTLLAGRWEVDRHRNAVKVNRIRYPYPNTLGLSRPANGA